MCKAWCQPFNLGAHHYFDFKGHGSWVEFLAASCFVFVCLLVFQLPRWVTILFLSLTSGWGFLVFFFVFVFCFVFVFLFCFLFLFVCLFFFVLCCFSFKMFNFPHHISRVRLIFFVSPVGKVFCFLLFLFVCFCFVLFCFCFQKFHPLDFKWCALKVRPYPYSIINGSNETHIIVHNSKTYKIGINWNFGNKLFLFTSSHSCHKKMLLEPLTIPLSYFRGTHTMVIQFHADCLLSTLGWTASLSTCVRNGVDHV